MRWLGLIFRNSGLNWSPAPISIGITLYARPSCSSAMCTLWPFGAVQDLTGIVDRPHAEIGHLLDHYNPLIRKLRALPLPVVCAVNGVAAGAGANLALACDIVLAAQSASFVQAFARIGLIPDCGGTWFLPRLVGMARARALTLLAEPLLAETAVGLGLISQARSADPLMRERHRPYVRVAR